MEAGAGNGAGSAWSNLDAGAKAIISVIGIALALIAVWRAWDAL
ncbi:MAG: hypothetical protein QOJ07_1280, partial [Thermoleophilaceae bacterium]|nr:hypothetical protein [Thermoleophilaceae bacterium]